MESVGARLKKIRLEKGFSLEEVHKKTKIHLNILKAIEEDSLVNFSPVYIKGFLKIYCKFLGVEPQDYLPDYKEPEAIVRSVPHMENPPAPFFKTMSIKLASFRPQIKIKAVSMVILAIIFIIGLFNLGKIFSARRSPLSKENKLSTVVGKKIEKKDLRVIKPIEAEVATVMPKPQNSKVTPPEALSPIMLGIRAREDCWVKLKSDGHVIFQNILRKGRFESWQAKDKIELSLGSAGAVDLEINGKVIPSLGRRGKAIKNILITKEGLSIPR